MQTEKGEKGEEEEGSERERDGDRAREGVCKKWQLFNTRSTFVGILCVKFFHYVLSAPERGREREAERVGGRERRRGDRLAEWERNSKWENAKWKTGQTPWRAI